MIPRQQEVELGVKPCDRHRHVALPFAVHTPTNVLPTSNEPHKPNAYAEQRRLLLWLLLTASWLAAAPKAEAELGPPFAQNLLLLFLLGGLLLLSPAFAASVAVAPA